MKIKTLILCFSMAGFLCNGFGQNHNKIDSLLNVLKRAKQDTTRVNTLNNLGLELSSSSPDTTIILAYQALSLSEKTKSKKHIADSYHVIGMANFAKGNYTEALKYYFEALKTYETIQAKKGIAATLINIGIIYRNQGDYPKALDYYFRALKMNEEFGNKKGIASTFGNIGNVYSYQSDWPKARDYHFKSLKMNEELGDKIGIAQNLGNIGGDYIEQGDYPEALNYLFKTLKMFEELENKKGIASTYSNIGLVYTYQSNYPKALDYHFKTLKMKEQNKDIKGIAITLGNIGLVYEELGDNPKALDYYFNALKIEEELGNKNGIARNLGNIGVVYEDQGDYSKALDYYFKALKIYEELGEKMGIEIILGNLGLVYKKQGDNPKALDYYFKALKMAEQLGDKVGIAINLRHIGKVYTETGKFGEAEEYLKKAIAMADSIGAMDYLRQSEALLAQLYDTTGRYKLALDHYKKAMVLKDTLYSQEKNKEITRKEMNYEFEKTQAAEKAGHEKQMAVADVEIKKQMLLKNSFIGGLALALVLFYFIYSNYRTRQKLKLETIRNNIAADLHDDIGSTLNSISIYSEVARKKDEQQDEALEMIGDASRKIIDGMSDIVWTINPDNDSFAKIIFRMKSLAYNLFRAKKIEFTFHADENLNEKKLSLEERRNFYLIFKEAVNNLVKYSNANRAAITLTNENEYIKLLIHDDGIGFDMSEETAGNGLKNMKRRADEIKAQFKLESRKGNGTQIELILKS